MLPEELSGLLVEAQQDSKIYVGRIPFQISGAIVCADEYFAIGDNGVAVGLTSKLGNPLNILSSCSLTGLTLDFARIPSLRNPLARGSVHSRSRAPPLWPIQ